MTDTPPTFADWVILELLGHRRLAGYLTEQTIAGHGFLRLDIPDDDVNNGTTQFVSPSSVYAIHPTTEAIARHVSKSSRPAPVQVWELPSAEPRTVGGRAVSEESYQEWADAGMDTDDQDNLDEEGNRY